MRLRLPHRLLGLLLPRFDVGEVHRHFVDIVVAQWLGHRPHDIIGTLAVAEFPEGLNQIVFVLARQVGIGRQDGMTINAVTGKAHAEFGADRGRRCGLGHADGEQDARDGQGERFQKSHDGEFQIQGRTSKDVAHIGPHADGEE